MLLLLVLLLVLRVVAQTKPAPEDDRHVLSASALLSFYRSLTRHRLFALLKSRLALGIAVFLVLFLYVRFETGYDRAIPARTSCIWFKNAISCRAIGKESPYTMGHISITCAPTIRTSSAPLLEQNATVRQGSNVTDEHLTVVDPNYFSLLRFPAISGDPSKAQADPNTAVITQAIARNFWHRAGDRPIADDHHRGQQGIYLSRRCGHRRHAQRRQPVRHLRTAGPCPLRQ